MPDAGARLFLCHNSREKALVAAVWHELGHDLDIEIFFDIENVEPGERWRDIIEHGLASCSHALVFLGGAGWGATHYVEATTLFNRAARDVAFVLIPVLLPGFDAKRGEELGDSRFFRDTAAIDCRNDDEVRRLSIARCRAFINGIDFDATAQGVELTVVSLRRDANRYANGETDAVKRYPRERLRAARELQSSTGARAQTAEIGAFLTAVERRHRRQSQSAFAALALIAVALLALFWRSEINRREALAARLAAESRVAGNADVRLLLALESVARDPTRRAAGALLERLSDYRELVALRRFRAQISALHAADEESVWVATSDGGLWRWFYEEDRQLPVPAHSSGGISSLVTQGDRLWAAFEDGRIAYFEDGWTDVPDVTDISVADAVSRHRAGAPQIAIAACGERIVAGNHAGDVFLIDAASVPALRLRVALEARITTLEFATGCETVLVATYDSLTRELDWHEGKQARTYSSAARGEPVALLANDGRIRILDGGGGLLADAQSSDDAIGFPSDFISAATLGPRRYGMPLVDQNRVLIGYSNGSVRFNLRLEDARELRHSVPHATPIVATALSPFAAVAYTGATDGTVAVYDLAAPGDVLQRLPATSGNPQAVAIARGVVWAVSTSEESAWRQRYADGWVDNELVLGELPDVKVMDAGFIAITERLQGSAVDAAGNALWIDDLGSVRVSLLGHPPLMLPIELTEDVQNLYSAIAGKHWALGFDQRVIDSRLGSLELDSAVRGLALTMGGDVLVAIDNGSVEHIADGHRQRWYSGLSTISALAAYDDGVIVAGRSDRGIELRWLRANHSPVTLQMRQLEVGVNAMALNESTNWLAAGDLGGHVHLYDLSSQQAVATINVDKSVMHLAISPDGTELLIVTHGDWLRLTLDVDHWTSAACSRVRREFSTTEFAAYRAGGPKARCDKIE